MEAKNKEAKKFEICVLDTFKKRFNILLSI